MFTSVETVTPKYCGIANEVLEFGILRMLLGTEMWLYVLSGSDPLELPLVNKKH